MLKIFDFELKSERALFFCIYLEVEIIEIEGSSLFLTKVQHHIKQGPVVQNEKGGEGRKWDC